MTVRELIDRLLDEDPNADIEIDIDGKTVKDFDIDHLYLHPCKTVSITVE